MTQLPKIGSSKNWKTGFLPHVSENRRSFDFFPNQLCGQPSDHVIHHLGSRMVAKMKESNPLLKEVILKKEADNLHAIIHQSQNVHRSHCSPLDIILPVQ